MIKILRIINFKFIGLLILTLFLLSTIFVISDYHVSDIVFREDSITYEPNPINMQSSFTNDTFTNQIFQNESFTNDIYSFLKSTQDLIFSETSSMDIAYYTGITLKLMESFGEVPVNSISDYEDKYLEIFSFVDNTFNDNGGYSNWNGARSSIESTFHAITLYYTFDRISELGVEKSQKIIDFINQLKTPEGGYFPLLNWDVPDLSSTYRALWIKKTLLESYSSLNVTDDPNAISYIDGNFIQPFLITGASGYSEIKGGKSELLASMYAILTYPLLNTTSPHGENVASLLKSLTAINGGVSGHIGDLPTTGFTRSGIRLYLQLFTYNSINLEQYLTSDFLDNAINYLKGNKKSLSGYSSSERDSTAELSSTFFVISTIDLLNELEINSYIFDFSGVSDLIFQGSQPTFGFGDFPGDKGDLSFTTMSILISKIFGNTSWINSNVDDYVLSTFSTNEGGFGFRPNASPRVKYTYYGVKALRSLSYPLVEAPGIKSFILNSKTSDGGFGQVPDAILSYISHTYWGLTTLKLLNELNDENINPEIVLEWLSYLKSNNGTYSNSRISDPSIISTYRALQIKNLLSSEVHNTSQLASAIEEYKLESGGFRNTLDKSFPTMEATYYGILLSLNLNLSLDIEKTTNFILSLQNKDGGFGLRPGFTSRVTSTYFAILSLKILQQEITNEPFLGEDIGVFDVYGPIIIPSFIPAIDTNQSIQGSFKTTAKITDGDTPIQTAWAQVSYLPNSELNVQRTNYTGIKVDPNSDIWTFIIGPFSQNGFVEFQIFAVDGLNNTSTTQFYSILTLEIGFVEADQKFDLVSSIVSSIHYFVYLILVLESIITIRKNKKKMTGDVKMSFYNANQSNEYTETLHMFLIILLMSFMAFLARLLMTDALLILENSLFLFRFLLAIMVILLAKYVLGLQSYGLFAPSVLVVAFLSLGAFWGMVLFLNIFVLLVGVRSLLGVFNLPVGFRIGILMVFTITYLGVFELVGEIFRIQFLSDTVFIPIIITPWIADRYISDAQQNDHQIAAKKLFFTLIISLSAYLLMRNDALVRFVALNPETWVVLVAILLYAGKYRKYTRLDFKRFKRLFDNDIDPLSLLIRNREYITQYNPTVLYPLINKFNMKEQFDTWRVPTPTLMQVITHERELDAFINSINTNSKFENGFVIKPSQSFGGLGIIVVSKRVESDKFVIGGEIYHSNAIREECEKIIQGEYLTSQVSSDRDIILIEEKIVNDPEFSKISVGLPDIRVIVFRGIPIMAMARLPTIESGGKANLKQGAIGAGISIATGEIIRAEWKSEKVTIHPDTNNQIVGYKFNNWQEILSIACLSQKASGLGYAGADLILDKNGKALVLEVNKRPGLEIQNINMESLLSRMKYLEDNNITTEEKSPIHSARKGMELDKLNWGAVTR